MNSLLFIVFTLLAGTAALFCIQKTKLYLLLSNYKYLSNLAFSFNNKQSI